jgi:hypothetical protein
MKVTRVTVSPAGGDHPTQDRVFLTHGGVEGPYGGDLMAVVYAPKGAGLAWAQKTFPGLVRDPGASLEGEKVTIEELSPRATRIYVATTLPAPPDEEDNIPF